MKQNELEALLLLCEDAACTFIDRRFFELVQQCTFNWDDFYFCANRHHILGLAYRSSLILVPDLIPEYIIKKLKQRHIQRTLRNLAVLKESIKIQRICSELSIKIVFFKGPVLSVQLYDDPIIRSFCDLDAWVSIDDEKILEPKLADLGYIKKRQMSPKQLNHHYKYGKDMSYFNDEVGLSLDLHWQYDNYREKMSALVSHVDDFTYKIFLGGCSLRVLEKHVNCCYLAYHGSRSGWLKIKWLLDFYHCYKMCDERSLLLLARRMNVYRHLQHSIALCDYLYKKNIKGCPAIDRRIKYSVDLVVRHMFSLKNTSIKDSVYYRKINYLLAKGVKEKRFLLQLSLLNFESQASDVPISDRFFYFHVIIRPFYIIFKHFLRPKLRKIMS
ncbi:MAG: nucleotidyltransferase family protein [Coxiellaceae bacterium]|nr:nucleotidyltransferase family protein [Coxiellaceae bacterium]MDF1865528.1 nucleotidyltransferase family protein [Saprospiraceae bacterium]